MIFLIGALVVQNFVICLKVVAQCIARTLVVQTVVICAKVMVPFTILSLISVIEITNDVHRLKQFVFCSEVTAPTIFVLLISARQQTKLGGQRSCLLRRRWRRRERRRRSSSAETAGEEIRQTAKFERGDAKTESDRSGVDDEKRFFSVADAAAE